MELRRLTGFWGCLIGVVVGSVLTTGAEVSVAQEAGEKKPQLVWVDTDIGDDIDDAFALGLILRSPEFKVLGVSTTYGDTEARARILDRLLKSTGAKGIQVTAGPKSATKNVLTQAAYGDQILAAGQTRTHADGVTAMLTAIRKHPGQVTLIALGPLYTVGATIEKDPETFRKLKRVVMMGGSIYRGYGGGKDKPVPPPDAEWNIAQDPPGFGKLLAAGVPLYLMPLDSTQVPFETAERNALFARGNVMTDQLTLLYHQWIRDSWDRNVTPTLFDPVAVAYAIRPELCPMQPVRLAVDEKGMTKLVEGTANAGVCLKSDEEGFLTLLIERLKATER